MEEFYQLGAFTMVPFLDMHSHSGKNPNILWHFDSVNNTLRLKTLRNIQIGEELSITYSLMPVQVQMVHYGHVSVDSDCYLDIPMHWDKHALTRAVARLAGTNKLDRFTQEVL